MFNLKNINFKNINFMIIFLLVLLIASCLCFVCMQNTIEGFQNSRFYFYFSKSSSSPLENFDQYAFINTRDFNFLNEPSDFIDVLNDNISLDTANINIRPV